jgi:hypothetical protein
MFYFLRFKDSAAYYHEDVREGLVRVCRLALHTAYPKYGTEGFVALYSKPPVIYVSTSAKQGLGQYICTQVSYFKALMMFLLAK